MRILTKAVRELKGWDRNPRTISPAALAGLKASIEAFGLVQPIIWNERTNRVVGGHQRLSVLAQTGATETEVVVVDLPEDKEKALNVALNNPEISGVFTSGVVDMLDEIKAENERLYEELLLDALRSDIKVEDPEVVEDDGPGEVPAEPVTKLGDLWELGAHRLICGDCTKHESVGRLMDGATADVCLTDPPYGLGSGKESGKNNYDHHEDSRENLILLAREWLPIARKIAKTVVFSPGVTNAWLYPEADWIMCWFYAGGPLRSPWGFNCWQPFLCYGKDPSLASSHGGRPDAVDMNTPANAGDIDHPCPKPVKLWAWFIERLSFERGDLFYEPFCGSGTTVIAAEQLNRKCYALEISPAYCDVIVNRWEKLTGKKAVNHGQEG